mmetsp:Transcript_25814/g.57882  ORF Transcript_25814/g.57882 Transcript_25814/m.57882 type:complete len:342 (-) Transcript_25814:149-1174(-)
MHVFRHEHFLACCEHLGEAGQGAVGEDVLDEPGREVDLGGEGLRDGVQEHEPAVLEVPLVHPHKLHVVARAHGLEHADRGDAVELPLLGHLPVVAQHDLEVGVAHVGVGPRDLLLRDADPRELDVVVFGHELSQGAVPATDIEDFHGGRGRVWGLFGEEQLLADELHLGALGLGHVLGPRLPVPARVHKARGRHALDHLGGSVVVGADGLLAPLDALQVDEPVRHQGPQHVRVRRRDEPPRVELRGLGVHRRPKKGQACVRHRVQILPFTPPLPLLGGGLRLGRLGEVNLPGHESLPKAEVPFEDALNDGARVLHDHGLLPHLGHVHELEPEVEDLLRQKG